MATQAGAVVTETGQIQVVLPSRFNTYKHQQLSSGCIRVIILLPGLEKDQINIELIATSLGTFGIKYEALSYMWGSQDGYKDYKTIWCGNQTIHITSNLYDALLALRFKYLRRTIWIDQIAINQLDNAEKSEQVQMMGKIYAKAERVWIWLSKTIYEDLTCKSKLAEFCDYAQAYMIVTAEKKRGRDVQSEAGLNSLAQSIENSPDLHIWDNFFAVISCGYMRRVWIIQEIVLAKEAFILISKSSFEWQKLAIAGQFIQFGLETLPMREYDAQVLIATPGYLRKHTRALTQVAVIDRRLTFGSHERQPKWTLLDLICKTAVMQSTDPRDKIFAVIGLLNGRPECIATSIVPNYSKEVTTQDLMRSVFIEGFEQGSMSTLLYIPPEPREFIPSWMGALAVNFGQDHPLIHIALNFDAGRDHAVVRQNDEEPDVLTFRVTPVGRITALYDPYPGAKSSLKSDEDPDLFFSVATPRNFISFSCQVFLDYYLRCADFYQETSGVEWTACREDFIRTFSLDHNINDQRITEAERWATNSIPTDEMIQSRINQLGQVFGESNNLEQLWKDHYVETQRIVTRIKNFRFACLTVDDDIYESNRPAPSGPGKEKIDRGQSMIMCWLPVQSEVGDMVCAVHGLALPMLARRKLDRSNRFCFIGPCYAHGIMDGEALSSESYKAEDIPFA